MVVWGQNRLWTGFRFYHSNVSVHDLGDFVRVLHALLSKIRFPLVNDLVITTYIPRYGLGGFDYRISEILFSILFGLFDSSLRNVIPTLFGQIVLKLHHQGFIISATVAMKQFNPIIELDGNIIEILSLSRFPAHRTGVINVFLHLTPQSAGGLAHIFSTSLALASAFIACSSEILSARVFSSSSFLPNLSFQSSGSASYRFSLNHLAA